MSKVRTVVYYKNYYWEFFGKQREKVKRKLSWTIDVIERYDRIPSIYFKHIENTDGLYEIRIQHGSDIYRVFCFFDEGSLVIAINGFQKNRKRHLTVKLKWPLK